MFQVIVVTCLVILVLAAVPQIGIAFVAIVVVILVLGAIAFLLPYVLVLFVLPVALYMLWYFAALDSRLLEAIEMNGGTSTVGEVMYEAGASGSETKDNCSWAVCRTYDHLDELAENGEIVMFAENGKPITVSSSPTDQVKIINDSGG